ncbi:hypothetical protein [Aeromicrobium sp. 179-A 4D2 NHS]|uniref:hypothetical protein n=1 Tax=Aeromicrobium sp. 179-A 4D2 NHS TaxID=3142375 RepID=UPI0039A0B639
MTTPTSLPEANLINARARKIGCVSAVAFSSTIVLFAVLTASTGDASMSAPVAAATFVVSVVAFAYWAVLMSRWVRARGDVIHADLQRRWGIDHEPTARALAQFGPKEHQPVHVGMPVALEDGTVTEIVLSIHRDVIVVTFADGTPIPSADEATS